MNPLPPIKITIEMNEIDCEVRSLKFCYVDDDFAICLSNLLACLADELGTPVPVLLCEVIDYSRENFNRFDRSGVDLLIDEIAVALAKYKESGKSI